MRWSEFLSYANSVKKRAQPPKPEWPKLVDVLDVQDQTAAVTVTAWWGTDYLHLARYDGR